MNVQPGESVSASDLVDQLMNDEEEQLEAVSDHESDMTEDEPLASTSQEDIDVPSAVPLKDDYVLVQFVTEEDNRVRRYVGQVIDITDGKEDEGPQLVVKFMRKKQTSKETNFIFPNVDDISDVSFDQVEKVLKQGRADSALRCGTVFTNV